MTQCFTYEVTIICQVLAESIEEAEERLNNQGGYFTPANRKIKLIAATKLVEPTKLESVPSLKPKKK